MTLAILYWIFAFGKKLTGLKGLICVEPSIENTEMPEWMISLGREFQTCGVVLLQFFIFGEFMMYITLFKDLYDYNKKMQNGKKLGLSAEKMKNRQRKNVITLSGKVCHCFTE